MQEWGQRIRGIEDQQSLGEKQVSGLATHFRDMKSLFDNVIKEAQDINYISRDLSLQVKMECLGEVNTIRTKMHDLEKIQSDVKRIEENINEELFRISDESERQKRANFNQIMDLKDRLQSTSEVALSNNQRFTTDIECMKEQYMIIEKDFRAAEFYINKMLPLKQHSWTCNTLHNVLSNKTDINNLVVFEHHCYHEFIKENSLNTAKKLT